MIQARVLLFVVLLSLLPTTWAARVLIIHGTGTQQEGHAQTVQGALASTDTVELRTSVPEAGTLATFDQAWDLRGLSFVGLSDGEIVSYVNYLALGKTLVALGEHNDLCGTGTQCFKPRNDSVLKLIDKAGGGRLDYASVAGTQTVQAPFTGPNPISNNDVRYGTVSGVATPGTGQFITIDSATGGGTALAFGRGKLANAAAGTLIVVFDVNWLDFPQSSDPPDFANLLRNIVAYINGGFAVEVVVSGLRFPQAVAVHNGFLYIADRSAHTVWKLDLATKVISPVAGTGKVETTSDGQTVLVAGQQGYNGDGISATQAQLNGPAGVAVDANGNVFVADSGNHIVRKINTGGMITTVAGTPKTLPPVVNGQLALGNGGPATLAFLNGPRGISVDSAGNIFIVDTMNQQVRKVDASGTISAVAGVAGLTGSSDGSVACAPTAPDCVPARLNDPRGVAVDAAGNVYVADVGNNKIRKVAGATVTSVAAGTLRAPAGVAVAADGTLYISDTSNNRIRRLGATGGVTTVASELNTPVGLAVDANGDVYIADQVGNRVLKIDF